MPRPCTVYQLPAPTARSPHPCAGATLLSLILFAVPLAALAAPLPLLQAQGEGAAQTETPTLAHESSEAQEHELVKLADVRVGSLLLRTDIPSVFVRAPTQETNVDLRVEGMIVRGRVVQTFHNPTDLWVEGVYAFPLPETAAVDTLEMRIGERVVQGVIQEREEAKTTYEKAKREGRKATLLEQERPNIFTTSVANLGPGEEIQVTIEYQHDLHYDSGRFSLRFPMVVGPRFIPGDSLPGYSLPDDTRPAGSLPMDNAVPGTSAVAGFDGHGWGTATDAVPDASRITPPVLQPADTAAGDANRVTLTAELHTGLALEEIRSPSHSVSISSSWNNHTVALASTAGDRDFVLEWWPRISDAPQAALFTEHDPDDGGRFVHLMLVPPQAPGTTARLPREVIYVIDTSGSMAGDSIQHARRALVMALDRLQPMDHFNVVRFDSSTEALHPRSVPATTEAVTNAKRWVEQLDANGGTNMKPALERALAIGDGLEDGPDNGRPLVRQVVFATDGAVGNEEELFALIHERLGNSRLFTVGIGSAPNSHFMRRAALHGRGTFTHIGTPEEVSVKMGELFRKLETPVLSDITVDWGGLEVEAWPQRVPDLYAGEPITLAARLRGSDFSGAATLRGRRADQDWEIEFPLQGGGKETGTDKLWARRKIASLMDGLAQGVDPKVVRAGVVALGLRHHLVTKYTSLVAVELESSRPRNEPMTTKAIPVNLPAGWEYEKVFGKSPGQLPSGAAGGRLDLMIGLLLIGAALLLHGIAFFATERHSRNGGA
jgi:Ca-activated chloride channel family protein